MYSIIARVLFVATLLAGLSCDIKNEGDESCGDGILDPGEECDGDQLGTHSCQEQGFYGGSISCRSDCTLNTSTCADQGSCGDGVLQVKHEECDGTKLGDATCQSKGYDGGTLRCDSTCSFDFTECTRCGDGSLGPGEECETGQLGSATCQSEGYYGGALGCDTQTCTFDTTQCETFGWCGDNEIQGGYGEECEGTNVNNATCASLGSTHGTYPGGGPVLCGTDCRYDITNCERCGDGVVNGEEACDGTDFGGATCTTYGFSVGGSLTCTSSCTVDTILCTVCGDGLDLGESCDGTDLGGATCTSAGLGTGPYPLVCDWGCGFTGCSGFHPVVAGGNHTCKVAAGGALYCWGDNNFGQLGDGSSDIRYVPTSVSGNHTFAAVSAGRNHTCGITTSGSLFCWGDNDFGQLGDGSTTDHRVPTLVSGSHTFASLSAGERYTCGVTTSGRLFCWGNNFRGQLGDGSTTERLVPTPVSGNHTFASLSAGRQHTCGVTTSGAHLCWGNNDNGRLGTGFTADSATPIPIAYW